VAAAGPSSRSLLANGVPALTCDSAPRGSAGGSGRRRRSSFRLNGGGRLGGGILVDERLVDGRSLEAGEGLVEHGAQLGGGDPGCAADLRLEWGELTGTRGALVEALGGRVI
jgi:hypothetical protein